jgi:hypothetical protein
MPTGRGVNRKCKRQKNNIIPIFLLPFCPQNSNSRLSLKKGSALPEEFIVLG